MSIKWKTVTWYSQIIAILLFIGIFYVGYYFGRQYQTAYDTSYVGESNILLNQAHGIASPARK